MNNQSNRFAGCKGEISPRNDIGARQGRTELKTRFAVRSAMPHQDNKQ